MEARPVRPITEEERLTRAIIVWADHHPDKYRPVLQIMGQNRRYSPAQLVWELENKTQAGELFLRILLNGAKHFSLEELIARIEQTADADVPRYGEASCE